MHAGSRREDAQQGRGGGQHFVEASAGDFSLVEDRSSQTLTIMGSPPHKIKGGYSKIFFLLKLVNACLKGQKFHTKPFRDTCRTRHDTVNHGWGWSTATLRIVPHI